MKKLILVLPLLFLSACYHKNNHKNTVREMPEPITNNAVALIVNEDTREFYSFNGLKLGKSWNDISNSAYVYKKKWSKLKVPKSVLAVLASTAVSVGDKIYLIGGYTVDKKGQEKSVATIHEYNTENKQWKLATHMPVPVDDTVALVYDKRYIYLISGWHDTDNVNLVQVYDSVDDYWFNATSYQAPAVFGHSGGIVGNEMLVCDGVKVVVKDKTRDFVASPVCMMGRIDSNNLRKITWHEIPHHSQKAFYRMAAVGDEDKQRMVFVGGSDNPYNFDGIGYNGMPSEASNRIFSYDLNTKKWQEYLGLISKNMDHRSLLKDGEWFYILGGMQENQIVSKKVLKFKLD